jgi:GGDEF domain-containing protein
MSSGCLPDAAPCDPPASDWPARDGCLALLSTLIEHMPGGARGTAVFLLDCCGPRPGDAVIAEVERRLRAASPGWHRLLQGDAGEFVVIAQGLVDGGAVLAAAARLVHAFDDALQTSNLALCPDVAIGIAFAPQHGARAEPLLAAAEASLRESRAVARQGRRRRLATIPPLRSVDGD